MKSNKLTTSACAAAIAGVCLTMGTQQAVASPLDLAETPLFLQSGVAPNLVLTLDDSGSMARWWIPDSIPASEDFNELYFFSAHYNGMAYDPNVTYVPPVKADGTQLSTSFADAWDDGFVRSSKRDLGSAYLSYDVDGVGGYGGSGDGNDEAQAFYAVRDSSNLNCSGSDRDNDCYDKVIVSSTSGPNGTAERQNFANWYSFYRTRRLTTITGTTLAFADLGGGIRLGWQRLTTDTTIEGVRPFAGTHRDKFYEWVLNLPASGNTPLRKATQRAGEYYKTEEPYRNDPADSSSKMAACRQSYHILMTDGIWNGTLSGGPGNEDNQSHPLPDGTTYDPRSPFKDDTADTVADLAFHYWLTDLQPNLDDIVPSFMSYQGGTADENYWNPRNDPADWQHMVTYTVSLGLGNTLTDPNWGGSTFAGDYSAIESGAAKWPAVGSDDSDNAYDLWHAAINSRGQFFSADDPKSLATAFKTILNRVNDRTSSGSAVALDSGSIASGDGVYIARFNSRGWTGQLVSYELLADGQIGGALWDAACALDGGDCATDDQAYTGKTESTRRIVTWNPKNDTGVPFTWNDLTSDQQNALNADGNGNGQDRLLYLRGDRANEEANGGVFRDRVSLLGDIVNSSPIYVGAPKRFYGFDWDDRRTSKNEETAEDKASVPYLKFKANHANRNGVVYVGANDGMLHAFSADTGEELFAYVPNAMFDNLAALSDPSYTHRFYVDGTPNEGDAFFGGEWHTVLVGGLRGGGQGIYALDVTEVPDSGTSEKDVAAKVLWEFTDRKGNLDDDDEDEDEDEDEDDDDDDDDSSGGIVTGDKDLGYTYSQPQIVRLHNGKWAAVFGNGYNNTAKDGSKSKTGNAVLYVVDIADGSLIRKIDTSVGTKQDPTGQKRPNGLGTVATADVDGDLIVDYVYAGDLYGNLWKFELRDANPKKWSVAYDQALFQAVHGTGKSAHYQPITTQPSIRRHPTGNGYLVTFGTGKYLEDTDTVPKSTVESVYGIWDQDEATLTPFTRTHLLGQVIERELSLNGSEWRVVSNKEMQWYLGAGVPDNSDKDNPEGYLGWYLDLKVEGGAALGEMQVTNTLVRGDRLIFTTLIPNDDPCVMGGESWLMVLDYKDGSRFEDISVFDVNRDGVFSLGDYAAGEAADDPDVSLSGTKKDTGILQEPVLAAGGDSDTALLGAGTAGDVKTGGTNCKGEDCEEINRTPGLWNRQSWRQMR